MNFHRDFDNIVGRIASSKRKGFYVMASKPGFHRNATVLPFRRSFGADQEAFAPRIWQALGLFREATDPASTTAHSPGGSPDDSTNYGSLYGTSKRFS